MSIEQSYMVPKTFIFGNSAEGEGDPGIWSPIRAVLGEGMYIVNFAAQRTSGSDRITSNVPNLDNINPLQVRAEDSNSFLHLFDTGSNVWRRVIQTDFGGVASGASGNASSTVLSLAARTATIDSADQTNNQQKGGHIILNVTAITGSPSIIVKIQGQDPVTTSNYYDIGVSTSITSIGTYVFKVYPSLTPVPNNVFNDVLPLTWRTRVEHANANSITYSIGANLVK